MEELRTPQRRRLPAWLLSSVLHLTVLLLLGAFYQPPSGTTDEPIGRTVSIVLAPRQKTTTTPEPDTVNTAAQTEVNTEVLPTLSAATAALDIQLPGAGEVMPREIPTPLATPGVVAGTAPRIPSNIDPSEILAEEAERRRRKAALGPETAIQLFGGAPAVGRSFVFLIDRSKSMGGQGLDAMAAAENELLRNLSVLEPSHRFQIIAYHHKCTYLLQRRMLPATPENLAKIKGHLNNLAAFGATEHEQALRSALYLEPDVVFLLTDGGDPVLSAAQLAKLRRIAAGRTTIHCIQFGFGSLQEEGNFLTRLAAQNGGSYGYVDMSAARSR